MRGLLSAMSLVAILSLAGCGAANKDKNEGPKTSVPVPAGAVALTPENTQITFLGTKKNGEHVGGFKTFSGSISPKDGDFTKSTVTVEIDTDSLYSDHPKLTSHLKSPDFFEVVKYPKASFVSTAIQPSKKDGTTHLIAGNLTLHGTTKSIEIPATVTETPDTLTLDSTFTFDRTEYGISYQPEAVNPIVTVKVSGKVARK